MPIFNLINYKTKNCIKTFLFALFMANKSIIIYNVSIFKDFKEQNKLN